MCARFFLLPPLLFLASFSSEAQYHFRVLHAFGQSRDGVGVHSSVILNGQGNVYGTAVGGRPRTAEVALAAPPSSDCGTVFELTPDTNGKWTEKILHSFVGNGSDGVGPYAGLIFDSAGNLYNTSFAGGAGLGLYGTVFEIIP